MEEKNKKSYKARSLIGKLLVVILGFVIIAIGVSFLLCCKIGTDPVSVFNDGLSSFLKTRFGVAQIITNSIMLIIVLVVDKRYINIGTILSAVILGPMIDTCVLISSRFISPALPFLVRCLICFIGTVLISLGVALYIAPSLGVGPTDVISEIISDKLNIQYRFVRITIDLLFVIFGYFLGGIVGAGTIIAALGTGPIVQFFKPYANKFSFFVVKKLVG